jgi:trehalose synthase
MREVVLAATSPRLLEGIVPTPRLDVLVDSLGRELRDGMAGRSVVNINTAEVGGGVAEMLRVLLPYTRGAGIDARWFVLEGDPEFFAITKRLHHRLHGQLGDGGPLGPAEAAKLAEVAAENASELRAQVIAGDVLVVHDPQPAGLLPLIASWGVEVIWRCHIGTDTPNEHSDQAWAFLQPFLEDYAAAFVFSRAQYAPGWVPASKLHVIHPSIDPLSPKNQDMDARTALDALRHVGIVDGGPGGPVTFTRPDGSPGRVRHYADIVRTGPPPLPEAPLIVQVSRWDPLKDMAGVMKAFVEHVLDGTDAHLVLAGPVVTSVADDPEAADVLNEAWQLWRALPHAARSRIQLVCLPMNDADENAVIVNALQRHAAIVVQKSLVEGFGLTVTEAMFKERPVVASGVGGIVDQIVDGETGLLVSDPHDLVAFGAAVSGLLNDPGRRAELGTQGRQSVIDNFLPDSSLTAWGELMAAVLEGRDAARAGAPASHGGVPPAS